MDGRNVASRSGGIVSPRCRRISRAVWSFAVVMSSSSRRSWEAVIPSSESRVKRSFSCCRFALQSRHNELMTVGGLAGCQRGGSGQARRRQVQQQSVSRGGRAMSVKVTGKRSVMTTISDQCQVDVEIQKAGEIKGKRKTTTEEPRVSPVPLCFAPSPRNIPASLFCLSCPSGPPPPAALFRALDISADDAAPRESAIWTSGSLCPCERAIAFFFLGFCGGNMLPGGWSLSKWRRWRRVWR